MSQKRISFSEEERQNIFDKTSGSCEYCHKDLVFSNRTEGERGAWHVDHGIALAEGGSNSIRNLWPACISCNEDKFTFSKTEYDEEFEMEETVGKIKEACNNNLPGVSFDLYKERRIKR